MSGWLWLGAWWVLLWPVTATSDRVDLGEVDLTDPEVFRHGFPHEIFTLLREEAPMWCHPATPGTARLGGEFWVVSKHADVQAVSRDYTRFRSYDGPMVQDMPPERQGTQIVTMDPPAHTRLRRLISSGFIFFVLATAGSETVREAITAGLIVLLDHPEQLERMRREPEVMPTAVEEILRWASPADYFRRTATEDLEIRGVTIAPGERLTLWYPSANRDADVFPDPFRFDIGRPKNPHVTFGGGGVHYCMGANLAKREIQVIYEELLRQRRRHRDPRRARVRRGRD